MEKLFKFFTGSASGGKEDENKHDEKKKKKKSAEVEKSDKHSTKQISTKSKIKRTSEVGVESSKEKSDKEYKKPVSSKPKKTQVTEKYSSLKETFDISRPKAILTKSLEVNTAKAGDDSLKRKTDKKQFKPIPKPKKASSKGLEDESNRSLGLELGVPLEECTPSTENAFVPGIVCACTKIVEKQGVSEQGIYRYVQSVEDTQLAMRQLQKNGEDFEGNVHLVASVLKFFLTKLPNGGIIGKERRQECTRLTELFPKDREKFMEQLKHLLYVLPRHNFETLRHLALHLHKVSLFSDENMMNAERLSTIFGCLVFCADLLQSWENLNQIHIYNQMLESIIHHWDWYFDPACEEPPEKPSANDKTTSEIDRKYLEMPLKQRRHLYHCKKMYVTLSNIPTWSKYTLDKANIKHLNETKSTFYPVKKELNDKISLWFGDITCLEIDCIVSSPVGQLDDPDAGSLGEAVIVAGGPVLKERVHGLVISEYSGTLITPGFLLPAKYIIHVRSPHRYLVNHDANIMKRTYTNCLDCAKSKGLKSIAFPCLSTAGKGLHSELAASIALRSVREWLECEDNAAHLDRVIFCILDSLNLEAYNKQMPLVFPWGDNSVAVNIPLEILNMDDRSVEVYQVALKRGKEKVYHIRLMVVGPFGVGKTTLTNRLLQLGFSLEETESTNGVDVHVCKCAVSVLDGEWIFQKGEILDLNNYHLRLAKILTSSKPMQAEPPKRLTDQSDTNVELPHDDDETLAPFSYADGANDVTEEMSPLTTVSGSSEPVNKVSDSSEPVNKAVTFVGGLKSESPSSLKNLDLFWTMQRVLEQLQKTNPQVQKNIGEISVWDFGGQFVFYSTHQTFLSPRAIYLVVVDISKGLMDAVEDDECFVDFYGLKYLKMGEYLIFWLNSIHTYGSTTEGGSPPVILIGTHLDKLQGDKTSKVENFFDEIRGLLRNQKPIFEHLIDTDFAIDNTIEDSNLVKLRQKIFEIASKQNYWGEEIPASWMTLEKALTGIKSEVKQIVSFKEVQEIDSEGDTQLNDPEEIDLFLRFQNSLGNIIYISEDQFREYIILEPQWLIDAFKSLITAKQFCMKNSAVVDKWYEFNDHAVLRRELVDAVWKHCENRNFYQYRDHLLSLMERLDIIAIPAIYSEESETKVRRLDFYFAPCMLKETVSEKYLSKINQKASSTPYLCIVFQNSFVPPAIFHRLLAACMSKWPVACQMKKLLLFCGCGIFDVDKCNRLMVCMNNHLIQICLFRFDCKQSRPDTKMCTMVRDFISDKLIMIIGRYQQHLPFTLHIKCNFSSFTSMDGLLPVEELMTERNVACHNHVDRPSHAVDSLQLLKYWFDDHDLEHLRKSQDNAESRLPFSQADRCPTEKELSRIAHRIGKEYIQLGIMLGVDSAIIDQIRVAYPTDIAEQCFQILLKWIQKYPFNCTLASLEATMMDIGIDVQILYEALK